MASATPLKAFIGNRFYEFHISLFIRFEGMGGFYKGLRINIIRVLPGTMITFGAYEFFSTYFKTHAQAN